MDGRLPSGLLTPVCPTGGVGGESDTPVVSVGSPEESSGLRRVVYEGLGVVVVGTVPVVLLPTTRDVSLYREEEEDRNGEGRRRR